MLTTGTVLRLLVFVRLILSFWEDDSRLGELGGRKRLVLYFWNIRLFISVALFCLLVPNSAGIIDKFSLFLTFLCIELHVSIL